MNNCSNEQLNESEGPVEVNPDREEDINNDIEESNETSDNSQQSKRKLKTTSVEYKLEAIDWYRTIGEFNKNRTAKQFNVTPKTIRDWLSKEEKYRKTKNNRFKRNITPKEKPKFPCLEEELLQWIRTKRKERRAVTGPEIKKQALALYTLKNYGPVDGFTASNGWFINFLKRKGLSLRWATSVGQKVPEDAKEIALEFFDKIDDFRNQSESTLIYNMDEMPVYFDMPHNQTYEASGSQTVKIATTGHEKTRFSLILCADNEGRKCNPAIIFKRKTIPNEAFPPGIEIMASEGGSSTRQTMEDWVKNVYHRRPGSTPFTNIALKENKKKKTGRKYSSLLTLDSAPSHIPIEFKQNLSDNYNTKVELITGGMTPLLQPADVSWNKPIKGMIREEWSNWMNSDRSNNMTKFGNPKGPPFALVAKWCLNAWEQLDSQLIIDSFNYCNLGKVRRDEGIHSKLMAVMIEEPKESEPDLNPSETVVFDDE